jgi:hypothetical protein
MDLRGATDSDIVTVHIDVADNSLSRKWLSALNVLLQNNYHLEKNYCFVGFLESARNGAYILDQVNQSIKAINDSDLGYKIDDYFSMDNCITDLPVTNRRQEVGRNLIHNKLNHLHRYFEDLQGISGAMSPYYNKADSTVRWHIRQLNLLCHEFESWALSYRKEIEASEWRRPSQLMCWLHAPRFLLEEEDYKLFGVDTIARPLGGVFVGVNKAVGKHHWEVFHDEGRDSRIGELTTTTLESQTEAAGDFDIEWGNNPGKFSWQQQKFADFKTWLISNGFDPEDKSLTIGHPQVAQVDLMRSFGTENYADIWSQLGSHLDVYKIRTSDASATYSYNWSDSDYPEQQIKIIQRN